MAHSQYFTGLILTLHISYFNFDAWGRKRNASTWTYTNVVSVPDWLYRGYTGHEHLTDFGIINMNARLYDPVLGRMLSPDNFVGSGGSQAWNRYSYANNNPLKFVDPDGNNPVIIVGAVVGGLVNLGFKAYHGQIHNGWDAIAAFGIGAVGGAVTAATGGAVAGYVGLGTTGIASGIVTGGAGAVFGSPVTGFGNTLYFNDPTYSFKQWGKDIVMGALIGGAVSGGIAAWKGQNIWWGNTSGTASVVQQWQQGFRTEPTTPADELFTKVPSRGPVQRGIYSSETAVVTASKGGVTVQYRGSAVSIYRGGNSFTVRKIDIKLNSEGLVSTTRGLSLDVDPNSLTRFGGAHQIVSMPEGLNIIQFGRPGHFEIVPSYEMSVDLFQNLLNQIKTVKKF